MLTGKFCLQLKQKLYNAEIKLNIFKVIKVQWRKHHQANNSLWEVRQLKQSERNDYQNHFFLARFMLLEICIKSNQHNMSLQNIAVAFLCLTENCLVQ